MTNTTTTPFDCAGEHVFQFGECIYCDTPEAQQAPLVIATRPNPIKVQVIATATDGDVELIRAFEIAANQACEVTQRIVTDDLKGIIIDPAGMFQSIDVRIEVPNIAMALTDQLIAASAEIDALRAANHAHSIASADLGRRAELAELLVDELTVAHREPLDAGSVRDLTAMQMRAAALAADNRDLHEIIAELRAELAANLIAPPAPESFAGRGNSMIETLNDRRPTRHPFPDSEREEYERRGPTIAELVARIERIERELAPTCRFCDEPSTGTGASAGLCDRHSYPADRPAQR